jgi:hypothetical protein
MGVSALRPHPQVLSVPMWSVRQQQEKHSLWKGNGKDTGSMAGLWVLILTSAASFFLWLRRGGPHVCQTPGDLQSLKIAQIVLDVTRFIE